MVHDDPYSSPLKPNQQPHELKKPRPNNPRPPGPSPPSPSPTTVLESNNEQDSNNDENYSGNPIDLNHDNSHDNSNDIDDVGGDGNYHVHDNIGSSRCPLETSTPVTLPVIVNDTTRNNLRSLHLSASSSISHHASSPLSFLTILKSKLCRLFFCIPSSTTTTSSEHHH